MSTRKAPAYNLAILGGPKMHEFRPAPFEPVHRRFAKDKKQDLKELRALCKRALGPFCFIMCTGKVFSYEHVSSGGVLWHPPKHWFGSYIGYLKEV